MDKSGSGFFFICLERDFSRNVVLLSNGHELAFTLLNKVIIK